MLLQLFKITILGEGGLQPTEIVFHCDQGSGAVLITRREVEKMGSLKGKISSLRGLRYH